MIQVHSLLKKKFGKAKSQRGKMKCNTILENGLGFCKTLQFTCIYGRQKISSHDYRSPKVSWIKVRFLFLSSSEGVGIRKTNSISWDLARVNVSVQIQGKGKENKQFSWSKDIMQWILTPGGLLSYSGF